MRLHRLLRTLNVTQSHTLVELFFLSLDLSRLGHVTAEHFVYSLTLVHKSLCGTDLIFVEGTRLMLTSGLVYRNPAALGF